MMDGDSRIMELFPKQLGTETEAEGPHIQPTVLYTAEKGNAQMLLFYVSLSQTTCLECWEFDACPAVSSFIQMKAKAIINIQGIISIGTNLTS